MLIVPSSRCIYLPPQDVLFACQTMFSIISPFMFYVFYSHFSTHTNRFPVPWLPLLSPLPRTIVVSSLDCPLLSHFLHCLSPIWLVIDVSLLLLLERWSWFSVVNTWAYCVSQCFAMVPHRHEQSQSFSYVAYHSLCLSLSLSWLWFTFSLSLRMGEFPILCANKTCISLCL